MTQRYLGLLMLICVAYMASASDDQPAVPLSAGSSKVLNVPNFPFSGSPQCDSSGNLYFHSGRDPKKSVILRLAEADGTQTAFRVPDANVEGMYFLAFSIVDDKVWVLVGGAKDEIYTYAFSSADPVNATRTELEAPKGLDALSVGNFVVLPNANILLQGFFSENAPASWRGKGYRAEFNKSGKLARITTVRDRDGKLREASRQAANSSAGRAPQALTYLLEPHQVVVLAPGGEVLRRLRLNIPKGFVPYQLYLNGKRQLIVTFIHSEKENIPTELKLALINLSNGETIRLYEPSPELGNVMLCLSDEGPIFLRLDKEKKEIKLITAPMK